MSATPTPRTAFDLRLLIGTSLLAAAGVSFELAWLHARATAEVFGVICGGGAAAHCAACYAAPLLAWAGLSTLFAPTIRRRLASATATA